MRQHPSCHLWDTSSDELEMLCGVTREVVMDRLRDLGVEVPRGYLPPSPVRRPQTRVSFRTHTTCTWWPPS